VTRDPAALASRAFDVIVVGGGICGAAIAWDAAQRGLSVALLERGDFGGATSANSLKIVHGGIRYLQHLDVVRVRQSSRERAALLRIAPHLVNPLPVVVPTVGHGIQGRELLAAGFATLNALTYDRNRGLDDPARRIPPARLIGRSEALERCPGFEGTLDHAGLFWDGQVYNPPRLVWAFIRSAIRAGAVAVNYCEVTGFLRRGNRIIGVTAEDRLSGDRLQVLGQVVVNAAGPFADQLAVDGGLRAARSVPLSRDMALVIRRPLLRETALAIQTIHRDPDAWFSRGHRHLFVVPWHGVTLIGVHSIVYRDNPYALRTTPAEVETFLAEIGKAMPWWAPREADVAGVYAGLLPIGHSALRRANVSFGKRAHLIDNAETDRIDGLVTVVANRLTTARGVAEQTVSLIFRKRGVEPPPCRTAHTPLYGGEVPDVTAHLARARRELAGRTAPAVAERLARNHGAEWSGPIGLAPPGPLQTVAGSDTLAVEVVYAVRHEMARTLADCALRRTDLATADHPGEPALAACAGLVAGELGWDAARVALELEDARARLNSAAASPGVAMGSV
jgi:glycerol-3-phosphate dehydrogenase